MPTTLPPLVIISGQVQQLPTGDLIFGQSTAPSAFVAGTQTATSGTITFSNSNGVTFGMSNNVVTASVSAGIGGGVMISAGTQLATSGTVVFSNANNITFGMSGSSQITAQADMAFAVMLIGV